MREKKDVILIVLFIFLFSLFIRLFVSFRTLLPSVDGVIYLHMASSFARGHWKEALARVFHPLYPLSFSPLLWLGMEPFDAARLVSSLFGALFTLVVFVTLKRMGFSKWVCVFGAAMTVTPVFPVKYVGDGYSEPLFMFLAGISLCYATRAAGNGTRDNRKSVFISGLFSGLAFATRPEGGALVLGLVFFMPTKAVFLAAAAIPALPYFLSRVLLSSSSLPSPLISFMLYFGPFGEPSLLSGAIRFLLHLSRIFILGFETFEPLKWILVLVGTFVLAVRRKRTGPGVYRIFLAVLGLACVGMACFEVKRRYLADWAIIFAVLSAYPLEMALRKPGVLRFSIIAAFLVTAGIDIVRLYPIRREDKVPEKVVGSWIKGKLEESMELLTDFPRIAYYAGKPPPPPRVPTAKEFEERCRAENVVLVILGRGRKLINEFKPPRPWKVLHPPGEIGKAASRRGIVIFYHPGRIDPGSW